MPKTRIHVGIAIGRSIAPLPHRLNSHVISGHLRSGTEPQPPSIVEPGLRMLLHRPAHAIGMIEQVIDAPSDNLALLGRERAIHHRRLLLGCAGRTDFVVDVRD